MCRPIVVSGCYQDAGTFQRRGKKGPNQELLVTDEDRCTLVLDSYGPRTKQAKGNAIGAKGFPHRKGHGNSLIVNSRGFLASRNLRVVVPVDACEAWATGPRKPRTYEDHRVPICDILERFMPESLRCFVPLRYDVFWKEQKAGV